MATARPAGSNNDRKSGHDWASAAAQGKKKVTVPAGTRILIRTVDTIDSSKQKEQVTVFKGEAWRNELTGGKHDRGAKRCGRLWSFGNKLPPRARMSGSFSAHFGIDGHSHQWQLLYSCHD